MEWSKAKDVLLAKEVLYLEPFQFKERTAQSVQACAGFHQQPHEKLPRGIREANLKGC